jgi:hypothetical protein
MIAALDGLAPSGTRTFVDVVDTVALSLEGFDKVNLFFSHSIGTHL